MGARDKPVLLSHRITVFFSLLIAPDRYTRAIPA